MSVLKLIFPPASDNTQVVADWLVEEGKDKSVEEKKAAGRTVRFGRQDGVGTRGEKRPSVMPHENAAIRSGKRIPFGPLVRTPFADLDDFHPTSGAITSR